jgi:hypothetical protein
MILLNIWNLEDIYGATKTQLPRKVDGAQSSKNQRLIPLKDISS